MTSTNPIPSHLKGLTEAEVIESRARHGSNESFKDAGNPLLKLLKDILNEPMLVLLMATAIIYFIIGERGEGYFMVAAIIIVSGISFYQERRSRKALEALQALTEPLSRVIRQGQIKQIPTHEIVVGDLVLVNEGETINADGLIVHSNDLSLNESSLTGEAYSVFKSAETEDRKVYSGTTVVSGLAVYSVTDTGASTRAGKLGSSILEIKEESTPLQLQIRKFVRGMALIGTAFFLLVWAVNYFTSYDVFSSLLKGLTLAMSVLPEEIPVAFTTFMAIGSWRLMQSGIIVRKTGTVEALGSATVICTDKTGTITENRMNLQAVYAFANDTLYEDGKWTDEASADVIRISMWASEPIPFDPMEKTLHHAYEETTNIDERRLYSMVHEYPLGGLPPMMTHVFENNEGQRIIAAKGAPEAILRYSSLNDTERSRVIQIATELEKKGYRILGVASSPLTENDLPAEQQQLPFEFSGLVAFYDPPKPHIENVFRQFYDAGIDVKVFTGDSEYTTGAIARFAGIRNETGGIRGAALMELSREQRQEAVNKHSIFTRMYPEAKLAAVESLKEQNEVVAMIGDGVNDGPALKAAHIGVAMGHKGTEIAKAAAALVLVNDDLSKLVEAVASGRRIYANIKKAVQYIISIHIPIILVVSLPLFLGWIYPSIFTPVHVIFLELIMGPTCSIVYENEPIEKNAMIQPPRKLSRTFLSWREMGISIVQGLVISASLLLLYQYAAQRTGSEEMTRTMIFTALIFANIFLTLVNRSFYYSFIESFTHRNWLMRGIILLTLLLLAVMLYVTPVTEFFKLVPLDGSSLLICIGTAAVAVFWFEIWKWKKRQDQKIHPA